jgi:hypothetical protein
MEELIKQASLHVDVIGPHDLVGPDGEIILPRIWETMIQPDWVITMHMWPMPDSPQTPSQPRRPPPLPLQISADAGSDDRPPLESPGGPLLPPLPSPSRRKAPATNSEFPPVWGAQGRRRAARPGQKRITCPNG